MGSVRRERNIPDPIHLRPYQSRIVKEFLHHGNSVVVLPTGAGKTLIAAEALRELGLPAIFFVPTCLLVEQQAAALREWTGLRVGEYMGGMKVPQAFDILVATPKSFHAAQARGVEAFGWGRFGVVVFDEVHHVLKDHPYRFLAKDIRTSGQDLRVLGLTASLTYAVGEKKITKAVGRLCADLAVQHMAVASDEELRAGGYHALRAPPEVKPVELPQAIMRGVIPPADRKPHLMHKSFFNRIKSGQATPIAQKMYACICAMEIAMREIDPSFTSPLPSVSLKEWGIYANKREHLHPLYLDLQHWYEALRLLVVSWEEAEDTAVEFLRMQGAEDRGGSWPSPRAQSQLAAFWSGIPAVFPRFEHLKDVLCQQYERTANFRGLVFVEQRVTTHVLQHVLQCDARFSSACLYATKAPATPTLSVSPAESKQRITAFAKGEINLRSTESRINEMGRKK